MLNPSRDNWVNRSCNAAPEVFWGGIEGFEKFRAWPWILASDFSPRVSGRSARTARGPTRWVYRSILFPHMRKLGRTPGFAAAVLGLLVREAEDLARSLDARNLLPSDDDTSLFRVILENLQAAHALDGSGRLV